MAIYNFKICNKTKLRISDGFGGPFGNVQLVDFFFFKSRKKQRGTAYITSHCHQMGNDEEMIDIFFLLNKLSPLYVII